ncbi:MAG TPA: hypothetical protein VK843_00190 [Planctomycetota bacterium]|nr:hypothetical protein [Planctomycetota bacterium]
MQRFLFFAFLLAAPGCITPNVLDTKARVVEQAPAAIVWEAARPENLRGLFESTAIEGEAAASYWKIYYHFADDGTYTGAALVIGGEQPQFQTLAGIWKLDDQGLDLGNGQSGRAFAAPGMLKLESEGVTVILKIVAAQ